MKFFFDGMQKLMEGSLDSETIIIMEAQTAECKLFRQQVKDKVANINAEIESLKGMFTDSHND